MSDLIEVVKYSFSIARVFFTRVLPIGAFALTYLHQSPVRAQVTRVVTIADSLDGGVGGLAVDRLGNVFSADFRNTIWKIRPDGRVSAFATGFYGSSGTAVDKHGVLYQANFSGNYLSRVDRKGNHDIVVERGLSGPVGEVIAADGQSALQSIDLLKPDIVFLDISMPRLSGLDVVRRMKHNPFVIFTTAYSRYAVPAFELQALDYLLKPFGSRRFTKAVDRASDRIRADRSENRLSERYESALNERFILDQIFVRDRGRLVSVRLSEILYIQACDDYARLITQTSSYLVNTRMGFLETRLSPNGFVRIHRSYIVNLASVSDIKSTGDGRVCVEIEGGERIQASRAGSARLKSAITASAWSSK